jgi:hypothetical protein
MLMQQQPKDGKIRPKENESTVKSLVSSIHRTLEIRSESLRGGQRRRNLGSMVSTGNSAGLCPTGEIVFTNLKQSLKYSPSLTGSR